MKRHVGRLLSISRWDPESGAAVTRSLDSRVFEQLVGIPADQFAGLEERFDEGTWTSTYRLAPPAGRPTYARGGARLHCRERVVWAASRRDLDRITARLERDARRPKKGEVLLHGTLCALFVDRRRWRAWVEVDAASWDGWTFEQLGNGRESLPGEPPAGVEVHRRHLREVLCSALRPEADRLVELSEIEQRHAIVERRWRAVRDALRARLGADARVAIESPTPCAPTRAIVIDWRACKASVRSLETAEAFVERLRPPTGPARSERCPRTPDLFVGATR